MDQKVTGIFIAKMRKEKGFTQAELAEALMISDKTISKWETGKGLPEVSLMLPLCEKLGITVNELLSGKKLSPTEYKEKAEINIVELMEKRAEAKFRLIVAVIVSFSVLLPFITIFMMIEYLAFPLPWKIAAGIIGGVSFMLGIIACLMLEMRKAVFECPKCKKRFLPTGKAFVLGAHTLTTRYFQCPHCGEKSFCKRCLTLEQETTGNEKKENE